MPDYYQILGVDSSADLQTLEIAFRRKAKEYHPDRGGSHEQMLLINEAWEMLSNPVSRARYDRSRRSSESIDILREVAADAHNARERAQRYPRKWSDFEKWLESLTSDIQRAEYRQTDRGFWPSAGKSFSGRIFIAAGGILAPLFVATLIVCRYGIGILKIGPGSMPIAALILPSALLSYLGALTGAHLHRWFRQRMFSSEQLVAMGGSKRIIRCSKCGQKLRIPDMSQQLTVTCSKCNDRFEVSQDDLLPPFPWRALFLYGALTLAFLFAPEIMVGLARPADREYVRSLGRIVRICEPQFENAPAGAPTAEQFVRVWSRAYESALSVKKLPTAGVTPALVNAADAWSEAELVYLRDCIANAKSKSDAIQNDSSTGNTIKMRRDGLLDTMGLGLGQVFIREYTREKESY